ncbi:FAD-binding protein [Azospirillum melinis]|uniref:FAD-binding protein n=1 Tax=Azospirillum melinis TaxID=328839 RepID=A0ABX2K5I3_9PROT|nr:FAD-binding oxidoreductase [Azospirillum melinis]MBP2306557.1 FAD/FMN-containing dehydrogenase [Azospirillum melinis]NUA98085.1 FAD-binding protein [Azospirillum melinis]
MSGTEVVERARAILGPAHVLSDPADTAPFLADWRGRYRGAALGVVRPADAAQVAAIVRLCAETGTPLVPQGGNTGVVGGAIPDDSGRSLVLCLSRLNRVREVDPIGDSLTVEAGCTLAAVQAAAEEAGRLFPMSLGSEGSCQIGGTIATNAGGTAVLRYGPMRDLVLGLEVVLPDGTLWNGLRALRKDNTGYALKHLFIGAEGTLGIVTAATLKLFPRPQSVATGFLALPSLDAALQVFAQLRGALGDRVTTAEILSEAQLASVLAHVPGTVRPLGTIMPWYLLVEVTDPMQGLDLAARLEDLLATGLEDGRIADAAVARSQAQANGMWKLRHSVSEANRKSGIVVGHDTAVPVARIPDFVARATAAVAAVRPDARVVAVGHIGDGNIHLVAILPESLRTSGEPLDRIAQTISAAVHEQAIALGGTISAEHGIGQSMRDALAAFKGPAEMALMHGIKQLFDPLGVMNPGKVVAARHCPRH